MAEESAPVFSIGSCFGLEEAPAITIRPAFQAEISVALLRMSMKEGAGRKITLPKCDAYYLMWYLHEATHCDILKDGTEAQARVYPAGSFCQVDLLYGASIRLISGLEALALAIPQSLIQEISAFASAPIANELQCRRGETDEIIGNLCASILPFVERPKQDQSATLRHIATALCAHLMSQYANVKLYPRLEEPRSPISRQRVAREFMIRHHGAELTTSAIAAHAGLSERAFESDFRVTTGLSPSDWLLQFRVLRSQNLLVETDLSPAAIAGSCGFRTAEDFDQKFLLITGITPKDWRRTKRTGDRMR